MVRPRGQSLEQEIDALLAGLHDDQGRGRNAPSADEPDRIQFLRDVTRELFIPVFDELKRRYAGSGVELEMDASNFLAGGREIQLLFGMAQHRSKLTGTVIPEGIAFHETRYTPDLQGELLSGPMLRARTINAEVFRNFLCARLAILLRAVTRYRQR